MTARQSSGSSTRRSPAASGSIRRTRFQADATPYLGPDFHRLDRTSFVWRTHSIHLVGSAGATIATLVTGSANP